MWVSVKPAKGNNEILTAVNEASCDSRLEWSVNPLASVQLSPVCL